MPVAIGPRKNDVKFLQMDGSLTQGGVQSGDLHGPEGGHRDKQASEGRARGNVPEVRVIFMQVRITNAEYMHELLGKGSREFGRKFLDYRDIRLQVNRMPHAEGSATVDLVTLNHFLN